MLGWEMRLMDWLVGVEVVGDEVRINFGMDLVLEETIQRFVVVVMS